jgi:hypothetical protein
MNLWQMLSMIGQLKVLWDAIRTAPVGTPIPLPTLILHDGAKSYHVDGAIVTRAV